MNPMTYEEGSLGRAQRRVDEYAATLATIDRTSPHLAAVPEYPVDAIPDPLHSLIEAGERAGLPAAYVGGAGLGALAYVARQSKALVSETWLERPALWIALLGGAGTIKSPSLQFALGEVWKREGELRAEWEAAMQGWRSTPRKDRDEPPALQTGTVSDVTVEALLRKMAAAGPQVAVVDELRSLIGAFGRYANGGGTQREIGLYLGCWDAGSPVTYDRVGGGVSLYVAEPALSIVGTLQVEDHRLLGGVATGFRARWLPHLGPVVPRVDGVANQIAVPFSWSRALRRQANAPARNLRLEGEAREAWESARARWSQSEAEAAPGLLAAYRKADRQALRVATCIALGMGESNIIPLSAMLGALAVVDFALGCWRAIPEGEELLLSNREERLAPAVDRLAAWLERRPDGKARREQILRSKVGGARTAAAVDALLERYEETYPGSVVEVDSSGGRRPVIVSAPRRAHAGTFFESKEVPRVYGAGEIPEKPVVIGESKEVAAEAPESKEVDESKEVPQTWEEA